MKYGNFVIGIFVGVLLLGTYKYLFDNRCFEDQNLEGIRTHILDQNLIHLEVKNEKLLNQIENENCNYSNDASNLLDSVFKYIDSLQIELNNEMFKEPSNMFNTGYVYYKMIAQGSKYSLIINELLYKYNERNKIEYLPIKYYDFTLDVWQVDYFYYTTTIEAIIKLEQFKFKLLNMLLIQNIKNCKE